MELFDKKKLERIGTRLVKKRETIAVAESVTSGLVQFAISGIPDAAVFFEGGLTAYNIAQKIEHLQVEPLHALSVNCVSQKVANEMALHVCELYSSTWGIGVTGYSSPVPESANKVFAYYSIVYKNKVKAAGKITPRKADPPVLQLRYARDILRKLSALL